MSKKQSKTANGKMAQLVRLYVLARDAEKYAKLKRDHIADVLKAALRTQPDMTLDTTAGIARLHDVAQSRFDQKKAKAILGPRFEECYTESVTSQLDVQPNREGEMAAASREFAKVTEPDNDTTTEPDKAQ